MTSLANEVSGCAWAPLILLKFLARLARSFRPQRANAVISHAIEVMPASGHSHYGLESGQGTRTGPGNSCLCGLVAKNF